jgi:hypothetical protein
MTVITCLTADRAALAESTVDVASATARGETRMASRMERAAATLSSPTGDADDGATEAIVERVVGSTAILGVEVVLSKVCAYYSE